VNKDIIHKPAWLAKLRRFALQGNDQVDTQQLAQQV
jgi:hypothetical protein